MKLLHPQQLNTNVLEDTDGSVLSVSSVLFFLFLLFVLVLLVLTRGSKSADVVMLFFQALRPARVRLTALSILVLLEDTRTSYTIPRIRTITIDQNELNALCLRTTVAVLPACGLWAVVPAMPCLAEVGDCTTTRSRSHP